MRLVTGDKAAAATGARSFVFVPETMKGEVLVKVEQCLQGGFEAGTTSEVTKDDWELIRGHRNSLGQPAVCVAARTKEKDPVPGRTWSSARLTLGHLIDARFVSTCHKNISENRENYLIRFLDGDTGLWRDRVDWPGNARVSIGGRLLPIVGCRTSLSVAARVARFHRFSVSQPGYYTGVTCLKRLPAFLTTRGS